MSMTLTERYKEGFLEVYAKAVAFISIIVIVVSFIMGGRDILRLTVPAFTLNASLYEKYQSNAAYTNYGTTRKRLTPDEITQERTNNYHQLLRTERRNATQNLVYIGLALIIVSLLNAVLWMAYKWKRRPVPEDG